MSLNPRPEQLRAFKLRVCEPNNSGLGVGLQKFGGYSIGWVVPPVQ